MKPCPLCGTTRPGPRVTAGPELRSVHRACFAELDARSEALEHEFGARSAFDVDLVAALADAVEGPRKPPQPAREPRASEFAA